MSSKNYTEVVRQLFKEVYTSGRTEKMDQFFADGVQLTDPAVPNFKGGIDGLTKLEAQYTNAFPGKKVTIKEIITEGNKVFVHWICDAKHEGPLAGYSATGKKVHLTGFSIYEFGTNGKIKSINQLWDRMALVEQISEVKPLSVKA